MKKRLYDVQFAASVPARIIVLAENTSAAIAIAKDHLREQFEAAEFATIRGGALEITEEVAMPVNQALTLELAEPIANVSRNPVRIRVQDWVDFLSGELPTGTIAYQTLAEECGQMPLFG